jgi:hypothetical protein
VKSFVNVNPVSQNGGRRKDRFGEEVVYKEARLDIHGLCYKTLTAVIKSVAQLASVILVTVTSTREY